MANSTETLRNYRNLVAKVDELSDRIIAGYGDLITCRKGCDACCRHISLFPVEAFALATALCHSPLEESAKIRKLASNASPDRCPLLDGGICLLYQARPIICRTHGLPLLSAGEGGKCIDFCPKNLSGITSFPAGAVLDLDILNSTIAAINGVFLASRKKDIWREKERFSMAESLLLDL